MKMNRLKAKRLARQKQLDDLSKHSVWFTDHKGFANKSIVRINGVLYNKDAMIKAKDVTLDDLND